MWSTHTLQKKMTAELRKLLDQFQEVLDAPTREATTYQMPMTTMLRGLMVCSHQISEWEAYRAELRGTVAELKRWDGQHNGMKKNAIRVVQNRLKILDMVLGE